MIQARIRKTFENFTLDVNFNAGPGVTVLFGASGAGKTLTLDSIAGFVRPDEGRILVNDVLLYDGAARVWVTPQKRECGYVFQNYALFPHMTLEENLEFAAEKLPRLERHRRISGMIEHFQLQEAAGRRPAQCSGGQQQRCSIARALIASPRILLLDEPARGLDALLRAELYAAIRQVRSAFDIPVLLVTHDVEESFELGDQMLIMRDGRIVQSGTPHEISDRPSSIEVARLLGLHNVLEAMVVQLDPQRNTSLLQIGDTHLTGRYLPGRLNGDRIWVCIRRSSILVKPRPEAPGPHQLALRLERATPRPTGVSLEFEGGLHAESSERSHNGEWVVEVPPSAIHVLPG